MEAEFVNEYIDQLNKKLHDLTSQIVLSETRVAHLSKQLTQANAELERWKDVQPAQPATKGKAQKEVDF